MHQAKYEWIKAVRKARDELRAKSRYGRAGYLARKIATRREHFKRKRKMVDRGFEAKKQSRITREHSRWATKTAKWRGKGSKWGLRWRLRATRFTARMARRF